MKKSLLIATALLCMHILNAQTHIATPVKANKASKVGRHSFTQQPTAACDSLKLDSSADWSAYYYSYGNKGYVFGVSNLSSSGLTIHEDANYYDVTGSDYNYISGGLAYFAFANSNIADDLDSDLVFKVYDDGGGFPGNLLGSTSLKLSQVHDDATNDLLTEFLFTTPIAIPANKIFYVSIDHSKFKWASGTRDSIAIIADSSDQAPAAAWQNLTIDGTGTGWLPANQIWTNSSTGDALNVNLFLFPYVSNAENGCSTLPVSILNFKGSIKNNEALLSWNTATEFNNRGFEIQRSKDGRTFSDIGFISGAGTTTQAKTYSYTDVTLKDFAAATTYYRLKQMDKDGKASYSNVIPLSLQNILSWKLYPNPLKDKLTVELDLTTDTKVSVQVISKDGKLLLNADKGTLLQGQQQLTFNIANLASGSYFVRVKAGDKSYTQTVIKQ